MYRAFLLILPAIFYAFAGPGRHNYSWIHNDNVNDTIESRFPVPEGYSRAPVSSNSFAQWLRGLPLLPPGSPARDYTGHTRVSETDTSLAAVVDYNIYNKKLEQCMDIIIRFYAEYLYSRNRETEIAFYLPGNHLLKWSDWKHGIRPIYKGIDVTFKKTHIPDSSRANLEKYLREVFYYNYTQTCFFAYDPVNPANVHIGDFIIKKGRKGHVVLIVDIAIDKNGNKIALMGHGDTPARQFYILNYRKNNPWFPLDPDIDLLPFPFKKKIYWEGLRRF